MANPNEPNDAGARAFLDDLNFGDMSDSEYQQLLETNPQLRTFLEDEQKAFLAGELSLAQMMNIEPRDLIGVANIGAELLDAQDWEAAEDIFAGLSSIEPNAPMFQLGLASARRGAGNLEGALAAVDQCIALCDDGVEPDESGARREFESLSDALYMRGMIHIENQNAAGALADLRRVCDLIDDPDDMIVESCLTMIATLLGGEKGRTASLEADLIDEGDPDESLLAEHPELGGELERDITDVAKGNVPAAVLAGATDKELAGAADAGFTLLDNGRYRDAYDIFAGLVALDPNVSIFRVALGNACESLNDEEGALSAYDAACAIAAELPKPKQSEAFDPYYYRGKYHLKVGNGQQALEDLTKAIECEPNVENPLTQHAAVLVSAMMTAAEEASGR